ncbi:Swt1 family HEPN domain-containing protein [Pedococcus sp. KACC 23699]|uniref:Swt1 family HEPN domain-containing protein n=1 Tax=Pedococcus sp. KACC 23699 TaxID=3149228 RepID=A0AAU7JVG2_9MICO
MNEPTQAQWGDPDNHAAVSAALNNGLQERSIGVFARWWQLETWLRELAYVELRARYGKTWEASVSRSAGRQSQDAAFTHMEGADSRNPLAYLDYSQLLDVMSENWDLFGYALVEKRSWEGRQEDLKRIRHRIGHMRVPHPDDLSRLEQTLRDLERGAFIAQASYNRRDLLWEQHDPVTDAWLHQNHDDAQRLVEHARRNYDTKLVLQFSRRPWAKGQEVGDNAPGILWHADFLMRGRTIDPVELWHDYATDNVRPLLMHLVANDPWHIGFTFSAADPGMEIADAIGRAFDSVLTLSRPAPFDDSALNEDWGARARAVDHRILHNTGWNTLSDTTVPVSTFGAGSVVRQAPSW